MIIDPVLLGPVALLDFSVSATCGETRFYGFLDTIGYNGRNLCTVIVQTLHEFLSAFGQAVALKEFLVKKIGLVHYRVVLGIIDTFHHFCLERTQVAIIVGRQRLDFLGVFVNLSVIRRGLLCLDFKVCQVVFVTTLHRFIRSFQLFVHDTERR